MKLGGTVGAIKRCPRMTTDLVRAGITEKENLPKSVFLAKKSVPSQKKHPKFLKRLIFIFGKGNFFL